MTGAYGAVDDAIRDAEKLRQILGKNGTVQVRSGEEQTRIKATAHAWFNNRRNSVATLFDSTDLKNVDDYYARILEFSDRGTLRSVYISILKSLKKSLIGFRSKY